MQIEIGLLRLTSLARLFRLLRVSTVTSKDGFMVIHLYHS